MSPPRAEPRPPWGMVAVALAVGVVFATPLGYLLYRNAQLGGDVLSLLRSPETLIPLRRSLTLAAAVAGATAVLGATLAWLTTRSNLPGRRWWRAVVPLPLVIPSFVGAAALDGAVADGGPLAVLPDLDGFWGAFAVLTLLSYPYVYLPVAARLASLAPSLEEGARLLGRGPVEVFRTVVLPQIAGAVRAGALLVGLYVLSDFGAVQIAGYRTLTVGIEVNRSFRPEISTALGLILAALALAVVAGERALGRRAVTTEGVRAKVAPTVSLGRWTAPALAFVVAVLGLALAAPLGVLAWWSVRGSARPGLGEMAAATLSTSGVSVTAAVVAVAVVLPVAVLTVRHRGRITEVPNALVIGGFALPGIVIAFALAFFALVLPEGLGFLYQSLPLLVLAYVVHFGAQALRAGQVAVGGLPRRMGDAARMLGARRVRRLATVELPLMRPGLVSGGGLVLLSTMKELPATLILRPTDFDTLATRIWGAYQGGFLAETGVTSLVLVALAGVLTWLLILRPT